MTLTELYSRVAGQADLRTLERQCPNGLAALAGAGDVIGKGMGQLNGMWGIATAQRVRGRVARERG